MRDHDMPYTSEKNNDGIKNACGILLFNYWKHIFTTKMPTATNLARS